MDSGAQVSNLNRLQAAAPQVGSPSVQNVRVAAENESEKRIREIIMDNARELSMGKVRDIYERNRPNCTPNSAPPCV